MRGTGRSGRTLSLPIFLFVTFTSILNVQFISDDFATGSFQQLLSALFLPTYASIKNSCGLSLYWFLPCLFVLTALRYLLQFLPKNLGILLAFALHLSIGLLPREYLTSIPWVIPTSLHFLSLGLVVQILRSRNWRPHWALASCVFATSLGAALTLPTAVNLATCQFYSLANPLHLLIEDALLLSSFYWILQVSKQLTRFRPLVFIGQQSLGIYLTHSIVFFALFFTGKRLQLPVDQVPLATAIYFLTVAISLALSLTITRWPLLRRFFFPRNRHELMTLQTQGS